jgi:hypothetical protein
MVQINDISVDLTAQHLIIEAKVDEEGYWLTKVYVDTQDTYLSTGPSGDLVYEHEVVVEDATDDCNSTFVPEGSEIAVVRKMRLVVPQEAICASLKSNMFIVYIEANNGDIESYVIGTAMWLRPFYDAFLHWIREVERKCDVPRNFIYLFLQYQAMIVAIRTCNVMEAIRLYNKYFKRIDGVYGFAKGVGCGCGGR